MATLSTYALSNKAFMVKLGNAKIAGKSFRGMVQELILSGLAQYESIAQTEQLNSVYAMSKTLASINTKSIKDYIEAHANVVLVTKKDKKGDKIAVFQKKKIDGVKGADNPVKVDEKCVAVNFWDFKKATTNAELSKDKEQNRVFDKVFNALKAMDKFEDLSDNDAAMLVEIKAVMARYNRVTISPTVISESN